MLAVLRKFSGRECATGHAWERRCRETMAEVTHEALFDHWTELRKWIDETRVDRRLRQRHRRREAVGC